MTALTARAAATINFDELPGAHVNEELDRIRQRTRETVLFAILLHLLLFLAMSLMKALTPEPVALTEITWLEPEVEAPVPVPEAPRPVPVPPQLASQPTPEPVRFERERERAQQSLEPQRDVSRDLLQERLAALQQNQQPTASPALVAASQLKTPAPSIAAPQKATPRSANLTRGEAPPKAAPLELRREPTRSQPTMAQVTPRPSRPPDMPKIASASRRDMAGMTLVGPVADRRILTYKTPVYPDWAKRDAVEASVRLYFIVLPGGEVKENVLIQKTGGYEDFDRNAVAAILGWRFEALPGSGEQWGEITFNYRLSRGSGE